VGKKSTVAKATTNSSSLRATIPEAIVKELKLEAGDILDWQVVTEKGRKYAKIRRME
jgi:bifunctional DNA-binding transcriptional regulator/antitoxin component of YhaV-PrlF toxin-antitoxin module